MNGAHHAWRCEREISQGKTSTAKVVKTKMQSSGVGLSREPMPVRSPLNAKHKDAKPQAMPHGPRA
eukprot:scaffold102676_cov31-Tisochrysis_lutea.AAC.7